MSNATGLPERERAKTLLIVEGDKEKTVFFKDLIYYFPQLNIAENNIVVYGTNIYNLLNVIKEEYGEDWFTEDVDLPFVVGKKLGVTYRLQDFKDVFLFFDYERQDGRFDSENIKRLLDYFCDSSDKGRLYLNYPMLEAYEHFTALPDTQYYDRFVLVSQINGTPKYKTLVGKENSGLKSLGVRNDLGKCLAGIRLAPDEKERLIRKIMEQDPKVFSDENTIQSYIAELQSGLVFTGARAQAQFPYKLKYILEKYCCNRLLDKTFYQQNRYVYQQIALHCIRKAYRIQSNHRMLESDLMEHESELLDRLDYNRILEVQNAASSGENGFIWVLNTAILMLPDYKLALLTD